MKLESPFLLNVPAPIFPLSRHKMANKVSFLLSNLRNMLTLHLRLSHYNYLAVTYHYFVNPGAEPHSGPTISCTTVLQPNLPKPWCLLSLLLIVPKHFYIFTIQPSPNSKKKISFVQYREMMRMEIY